MHRLSCREMKGKFPPFLLWEEVRKVQRGYIGVIVGSKACSESSAAPGWLPRKMEGNRTCLLSDQVLWHALLINASLFLRADLLSLSLHESCPSGHSTQPQGTEKVSQVEKEVYFPLKNDIHWHFNTFVVSSSSSYRASISSIA